MLAIFDGAKLLFLLNCTALTGLLIVALCWLAAARGKWKKGIAFRAMVWSSAVGAVIPLAILAILPYFCARFFDNRFGIVLARSVGILWPSPIGVVAWDHPQNMFYNLFAYGLVAVMNSGLYGLLGLCVGLVWQNFSKNAVKEGD